jgi:hypothetical protein
MTNLIMNLKVKESMWYPSSGDDFRPVHHVAFNNLYIDPDILIFNDVDKKIDPTIISSIAGCEVVIKNKLEFNGVEFYVFKLKISFGRKNRIKELFFFRLSNKEMFEFLLKYKISPHSVLIHGMNETQDYMEIGWLKVIQELGVKYCYTDNWFNLSLKMELTFREYLVRRNIRYISKQSYMGFSFEKKMDSKIKLAINNCFASIIHLFEIPSTCA